MGLATVIQPSKPKGITNGEKSDFFMLQLCHNHTYETENYSNASPCTVLHTVKYRQTAFIIIIN
jgi:hypothetical protein